MARTILSGALLVAGLLVAGPIAADSSAEQAAVCLTAEDLNQIKAVRGSLGAAATPCDTCIDIAAWIIGKVGCGAGEAVLTITCTLAEIVLFEAEEVVAPICTGLEVGLGALCAEFGAHWIATHTRDAARIICQNIALCPKSAEP